MPADGPARLRVSILVDSLVVGGAERVVETLARRLSTCGVDVHLGCLRAPGPIGEGLASAGIPVEHGLGPSRVDPRQIGRVARWLDRTRADVLFALDHSNAMFFGRTAARLRRIPVVVGVHRTRRADGSSSLGPIDRLLLPWTDAVVAVSEGHARHLRENEGVPASKIRVVHNGVDPERFAAALDPSTRGEARRALGLGESDTVFGIVAALRPEKNHESLLRALTDPSVQDVIVLAVGDGNRRGELENLADDLGLADRVHWLGWRDDVRDVLAAIDALVLPSHPNVETFPLCVLEAMAAGRPAVATHVGSLDEMIVDGETGWLIPAGDEGALVRALHEVRDDRREVSRRGEAARRRLVDRFDEFHMVEAVARVLRDVHGERS